MDTQKVLSGYKEIASFLGVSTRTIQRHRKAIPFSKIGHKSMILESDLVDWVKREWNEQFKSRFCSNKIK